MVAMKKPDFHFVSKVRSLAASLHKSGSSLNLKESESGHQSTHLDKALQKSARQILQHVSSRLVSHFKGDVEDAWYLFVKAHASNQLWVICGRILMSSIFECIIGILIFLNMCIMVVETDEGAREGVSDEGNLGYIAGNVALVAFALELALRLYVFRSFFFKDAWNLFDFGIILVDVTVSATSYFFGRDVPISTLRIFRLIRLTKISKFLRVFPELRLLIAGLFGAISTIFWGTVLLIFALLVWSIVAVIVLHPLNNNIVYNEACDQCSDAYSSVAASMLTFWRVVIGGDSDIVWPMIRMYPTTICYYAPLYVTVGLAVLNLITGVVVSVAIQAKEKLHEEDNFQWTLERQEKQIHLLALCQSMDTDGDGTLSIEQVGNDIQQPGSFREMMSALNITAEDLRIICTIIDPDGLGKVGIMDLLNHCYSLKNSDSVFMLSYIKYYVTEIRNFIWEKMQELHAEVMASQQRIEEDEQKLEEEEDKLLQEEKRLADEEKRLADEEKQIADVLKEESSQGLLCRNESSLSKQSPSRDVMEHLDAHCREIKAGMERNEAMIVASREILEVRLAAMESKIQDTLSAMQGEIKLECANMCHPASPSTFKSSSSLIVSKWDGTAVPGPSPCTSRRGSASEVNASSATFASKDVLISKSCRENIKL